MQTVKKEYKQKRKEADGKRERGGGIRYCTVLQDRINLVISLFS